MIKKQGKKRTLGRTRAPNPLPGACEAFALPFELALPTLTDATEKLAEVSPPCFVHAKDIL